VSKKLITNVFFGEEYEELVATVARVKNGGILKNLVTGRNFVLNNNER